MKNNKAFTLLELMIAIAITGIIMLGMYKFFSSLIQVREFFEGKKDNIEIISKIVLLMQADIRAKITKFSIRRDEEGVVYLEFITTNSLFFDKAIPVKVIYFLKKDETDNKTYLYREEIDRASGIDLCIPLSEHIEQIEYKFFSHNQWQENPTDIIKVCLKIKNKDYCFSERGIIE